MESRRQLAQLLADVLAPSPLGHGHSKNSLDSTDPEIISLQQEVIQVRKKAALRYKLSATSEPGQLNQGNVILIRESAKTASF